MITIKQRKERKINVKAKISAIIVLLLLITTGIPILINCSFKQPAKKECFIAEWTAGEALSYYGTILTFLSTTTLSVLALWQNHVIQKENDKHTALLERMEREKNAPYLVIEEITKFEKAKDISFYIRNVSDNIAQKITLSEFRILDSKKNVIWTKSDEYIDYLSKDNSYKVNLTNPEILDVLSNIEFLIRYQDKFDRIHKHKVVGRFNEAISNLSFDIIEG